MTSKASALANETLADARQDNLRITEIFYSLQGESNRIGLPTVFIRLTGCPLRCGYCDTAYAFTGGRVKSIQKVVADVEQYQARYVTVTGGEPLAQKACLSLLKRLCNAGFSVSLETGGAMDVASVDSRVVKIMDIKTPGSGEAARNRYENVACLSTKDQVKFVICDLADYQWAKQIMSQYHLAECCEVLFSPAVPHMDATQLADQILADRLPVRFQIQLHKYLWGDVPGR